MTEQEIKEIIVAWFSSFSTGYNIYREAQRLCNKYNWKLFSGARKCCFVIPDINFVIKFPSRQHRENIANCHRELRMYNLAKDKYNCVELFPETSFLCKVNGVPFFKQERITYTQHDVHSKHIDIIPDRRTNEQRIQTIHWDTCISTIWIERAVVVHGYKKVEAMHHMVNKYHINDLHNNNIGYIGHRPVLLDFGGY